jgi:hypothetical protein
MSSPVLLRTAVALLLGLSAGIACAQADERALDAERRALEAERRALQAERRAVEAERRAVEADANASGGAGRAPIETQPQACEKATHQYTEVCAVPSREIGDAPQCAAAEAEMRRRCGPT